MWTRVDTTFSKNPDTPPAQPFPTDGRKLFSLWTCTISAPPPATAAPAASTTAQNYRQRRSALRSAKCHATRRAQLCTRSMLRLLFIVRAVAPYTLPLIVICQRHALFSWRACDNVIIILLFITNSTWTQDSHRHQPPTSPYPLLVGASVHFLPKRGRFLL